MNSSLLKIWVSEIIESKIGPKHRSTLVTTITRLGTAPIIIFLIFIINRIQDISTQFLLSYVCALAWILFGPYLIWYYDQKVLPSFFEKLKEIILDPVVIDNLKQKYKYLFTRKYYYVTIPWLVILLLLFIHTPLQKQGGIYGSNDIWYWVLLLAIIWTSLLTSIGFWGVLITILIIRDISKMEINIDPLHPDELSGLSCIGHFAITTTVLFTSGSLFLPAGFQLISIRDELSLFVYFIVIIFSSFILFSFFYPTILIYKKARFIRNRFLNEYRKIIKHISDEISCFDLMSKNNDNYLDKMAICNYLNYLRQRYDDYKNMNLYPFETETFTKLISSVILPFIFLLIQKVLG